jgi:hypothetical protein
MLISIKNNFDKNTLRRGPMNNNQQKIIKMVVILAIICVGVGMLTKVSKQNSVTLEDYARENPDIAYSNDKAEETTVTDEVTDKVPDETDSSSSANEKNDSEKASDMVSDNISKGESVESSTSVSTLTGALLNANIDTTERTEYTKGFYYEPLSDNLRRYITGVSYPEVSETQDDTIAISLDELSYVHIWHYNFDGVPAEGELICNNAIAQDMVEIFYELYRNEYQIEKVLLIDQYDGDDTASMEDNNTSCFNYRVIDGTTSLSKHAYGLAIDINPFYNPYVTYEKDGTEHVSPAEAAAYADRKMSFPYKIDESDLCYKLFKEHGFTWGGDWNSVKDYQHFQKAID